MSTTISTSFVEEFESEMHLAYQRTGSKLRSTVRVKNNVKNKTTFQKIAKGAVTSKSRHGDVVPMDLTHSNVNVTTEDWYAPEYVDSLDELRIEHDERDAVMKSGVYALGRKTDAQIIAALGSTSNTIAHGSAALTLAKAETLFENFGDRDVPEDNDRYWAVGYQQWTDLLGVNAFSSLDYVPANELPYSSGMTAKRWLGFLVFGHSGLTKASTTRSTLAYHRSAIGHAVGQDISVDITWQGQKQAYLIVPSMQQNAVLIDADGVTEVQATES